ncbi:MAG: hypothetical protein A2V90_01765 [Gammaproteobacteria bacterium RBG_16_57_12]|nr:MAG: hypothetical protein A2V90_01765 [Gammaproteobacteria bacterium RBG_16_57_12]
MKKRLIAIAVAAAITPAIAAAGSANISGFVDIYTTLATDDGKEKYFLADGEVDVRNALTDSVTVGMDLDISLVSSGTAVAGKADSGQIEQAFFAWKAADMLTVLGGVMNNPLGWEAEDAPDMPTTTHGQLHGVFDAQTAQDGNNTTGLAAAIKAGDMATVTLGVFNDNTLITKPATATTYGIVTEYENSLLAMVNVTPMAGLAIEAGLLTAEPGTTVDTVAGDIMDLNVEFTGVPDLKVAFEYLTADEYYDSAYQILVGYNILPNFGVIARMDNVSMDDAANTETSTTTLYASYGIADNLSVALEFWSTETEDNTGTTYENDAVNLEFIAKF